MIRSPLGYVLQKWCLVDVAKLIKELHGASWIPAFKVLRKRDHGSNADTGCDQRDGRRGVFINNEFSPRRLGLHNGSRLE